ncbi:thioredoxin [Brevibacillus sp. M2.1A]|uniref:thioredoxin n=1 Tax=Brevibacillus sp. M2.1A TaxID=2738980 RepID=UPI00156AA94C|nr:thioredoxin [Brevibacillus sp. M2.1A]MCC8438542.1 thioredoxin [Brevibacillus sp. M2.1A]
MSVIHASDATFHSEVESYAGTVLLDFWAPWCGPCKMLSPILDDLAEEIGDTAKIVKVNVDENAESTDKYGIMSIPTIILFQNGKVVKQLTGFQTKETLKAVIEQHK